MLLTVVTLPTINHHTTGMANLKILFICSRSLPENDKPGAETCRNLILVVNCILLSAFVGWYIEFKNKRGMSDTSEAEIMAVDLQFMVFCVTQFSLPKFNSN